MRKAGLMTLMGALLVVASCGALMGSGEYVNSTATYRTDASGNDTIVFAEPYPNGVTVYSKASYYIRRHFSSDLEDAAAFPIAAGQAFTYPGRVDTIFVTQHTDTVYAWGWYR